MFDKANGIIRQAVLLRGLLTVLSVQWLLSACMTPGGDYQHRSFHSRSIENDGLAVVGVVSAEKKSPAYQYLKWSKTMESSIREHHKQYPLISAVSVKNALDENYTKVLGHYRKYGELDRQGMSLLHKAPIVARFGILARIESDQLNRPPKQENPVKNAHGEVLDDRTMLVLSSQRTMTVLASVYDLKSGRLVWQRRREVSLTNNANYVDYRGKSFAGALTVATLNTVSNGTITRQPPDYPSQDVTLNKIMEDIASQLPGHRFE